MHTAHKLYSFQNIIKVDLLISYHCLTIQSDIKVHFILAYFRQRQNCMLFLRLM